MSNLFVVSPQSLQQQQDKYKALYLLLLQQKKIVVYYFLSLVSYCSMEQQRAAQDEGWQDK
jgi:hypothetical protein